VNLPAHIGVCLVEWYIPRAVEAAKEAVDPFKFAVFFLVLKVRRDTGVEVWLEFDISMLVD
jgi:hypothetical protein